MKRIIFISILLISAFMANAQQNQNHNQDKNKSDGAKINDRVQSEKIAFFTNALDLSIEEAQLFWPIYNAYSKETSEAHFKVIMALDALRHREGKSDAEILKLVDNYSSAMQKESKLTADYVAKFKKILPAEKVAKIFLAEDDFRMSLIHRFRIGTPTGPR